MHYWEAIELAAAAMGLPEDTEDQEVEGELIERYGIDMDEFQSAAELLLPLTSPWVSPISGTAYRGFVKDNCAIVKEEVK